MTELLPNLSPATTRAADGWPRRAWTHHDLDRMTEAGLFASGEHVELLDGEIIPMSAKGQRHELVRLTLNGWINRRLGEDKAVFPEPGWRPALRDYLEPDFLIVPSTIVPPEFPGADVLLAIEIADTSHAYDTTLKRDRYAALGVMEYWVVHAWELSTMVHRGLGQSGYGHVAEHPRTAHLTPANVPEIALRLADLAIA
jgi:Uma2 family endonuclease